MRKSIIFLTLVGLITLLSYCKKEGTLAVLKENPTAPTLASVPSLTFVRDHGTDSLQFTGTPADAGFAASVTYFLEADTAGNQFANAVVLASGTKDDIFKFTVSDLNGLLIRRFPTDAVFSAELRIRSVLVVTGSGPFVYTSVPTAATITTYGLPRLDLVGSGITQKIESPLGNGSYSGFVYLNPGNSFTLLDPDASVTYGGATDVLAVNGSALTPSGTGWFKLDVNTSNLTYKLAPFNLGIIGSATPNVWNSPDTKMQWDIKQGCWYKSMDLELHLDGSVMKCEFKFRLNDAWDWNVGGTLDNLTQGGANLVVSPGHYMIRFFVNPDGATGHCTLTAN